jgi:ubiquinone/menaquinone biosynthesis C-methylase UbiE
MHPLVEKMFEGENPSSIFEVGCAQGLLWKEYYDRKTATNSTKDAQYDRSKLVVGGIDIDQRNIPGAKENYPDYADNFILGDITKSKILVPDKSYDIVFTIGTLLLIPDPYPIIKEMLRICKKKIIIAEFQNDSMSDYGIAYDTFTGAAIQMTKNTVQPNSVYSLRIERDYKKVFKKMWKKIEIVGTESGKTIIKCKK